MVWPWLDPGTALWYQGSDRRILSAPTCRCRRPPTHGVTPSHFTLRRKCSGPACHEQNGSFFSIDYWYTSQWLHDIAWWFLLGGCLWVSVKICVYIYIYVYEQFVLVCVCFSFLPGATDVESSHCCSGHNQAVATALFPSSRYGEDIQGWRLPQNGRHSRRPE